MHESMTPSNTLQDESLQFLRHGAPDTSATCSADEVSKQQTASLSKGSSSRKEHHAKEPRSSVITSIVNPRALEAFEPADHAFKNVCARFGMVLGPLASSMAPLAASAVIARD